MKRLPLAALLAAFFIFLALSVSIRQAVLMGVGVGMGAALAGARFGFTTGWRQLIEQRNPQGVAGQVLLLALASLAALPLLGQKNVKPYAASMVVWSKDANGLPMTNVPSRPQQLLIDTKLWAEKTFK